MAAKLTRLTHKIAIQLHLVAESYTICSSRSRQPVRKLLDTPLYITTIKNNFDISTSGTKFRIETFRKSRSDNPFGERRSFIQFEGDNDVI